jgi:hypothetical protein
LISGKTSATPTRSTNRAALWSDVCNAVTLPLNQRWHTLCPVLDIRHSSILAHD